MIEIKNLRKVYTTATGEIVALDDINLNIQDGEIFGIIGLSGAGKSTLVRCINLLERPTSGQVILDGHNLTALPKKELLKLRQNIGMIFQNFNLLEQRTVLRNVTFPLEISGVKFSEAKKKAMELSELFGKDRFYLEVQDHGAGLFAALGAHAERGLLWCQDIETRGDKTAEVRIYHLLEVVILWKVGAVADGAAEAAAGDELWWC